MPQSSVNFKLYAQGKLVIIFEGDSTAITAAERAFRQSFRLQEVFDEVNFRRRMCDAGVSEEEIQQSIDSLLVINETYASERLNNF